MCVYVCAHACVSAGVCGIQKRASDPLKMGIESGCEPSNMRIGRQTVEEPQLSVTADPLSRPRFCVFKSHG